MMPQSVGERIAQARREKGVRDHQDLRPIDVARALGVSGAAVSDWEADKKRPREELLAQLADYLGTTPAYLRYGVTFSDGSPGTQGPSVIQEPPAETFDQPVGRAAKKSTKKRA